LWKVKVNIELVPVEVVVVKFRYAYTGTDVTKVIQSRQVIGHRHVLNISILQHAFTKNFKTILRCRSTITNRKQLTSRLIEFRLFHVLHLAYHHERRND